MPFFLGNLLLNIGFRALDSAAKCARIRIPKREKQVELAQSRVCVRERDESCQRIEVGSTRGGRRISTNCEVLFPRSGEYQHGDLSNSKEKDRRRKEIDNEISASAG